ncbi:MAG: hypothetical protein HKN82_01565 [Akkermansiaceae bacterium]|nr:hypothetical protein [Akkermansiaceae bacterium]NNM30175.1 hypothetical protein [Akkermansiaceae bacterium]
MNDTIEKTNTEEIIKGYFGDLLAFMKGQLVAANSDGSVPQGEASTILARIRVLLRNCVDELEHYGEKRFEGGNLSAKVKETVAKATGWAIGSAEHIGSHRDCQVFRDQYLLLNSTSTGCAMLYTIEFAANGDSELAGILLRHLREWNTLILDANRILPEVVLGEMNREEDGFGQEQAATISRALQDTWKESRERSSVA